MGQHLEGIGPVLLLMMWGCAVVEVAGKVVLVREHVRRVGVVFGLTLGVLASVMLLVSWFFVGTAPAGLAGVIFLSIQGGVAGPAGRTLLRRPAPQGVADAVRIVRVLTLTRAEARVQVLVRDVGVVLIWRRVQTGPLCQASCYSRRHLNWTFSRVLPVPCIFTKLTCV